VDEIPYDYLSYDTTAISFLLFVLSMINEQHIFLSAITEILSYKEKRTGAV